MNRLPLELGHPPIVIKPRVIKPCVIKPWHCGAITRQGTPCRRARLKGKTRCRLHGGACKSGAQPGNTNAWKHGYYSAGAIAERKRLAKEIKWIKNAMRALRAETP